MTPSHVLSRWRGRPNPLWTGARPLDVTYDTGVASIFVLQKSISVMRKEEADESPASIRSQLLDPVHRAAPAGTPGRGEGGRLRRASSSGGRGRTAVPADADVDAFVAAVRDAGVQLVGLNFFAGDLAGRRLRPGVLARPAPQQFRDNIDVTVGIGEQLGLQAFNALYGNRVDDASPQRAGRARRREPGARRQGGRAHRRHRAGRAGQRPRATRCCTAADALAVIDGYRAGGRRTSASCSPTCTTSPSTATTSTRRSPTYADRDRRTCRSPTPPDAASPAPATLPLDAQLADLRAAGYAGWVGLEYKPIRRTRPTASAGCLASAAPRCTTDANQTQELT